MAKLSRIIFSGVLIGTISFGSNYLAKEWHQNRLLSNYPCAREMIIADGMVLDNYAHWMQTQYPQIAGINLRKIKEEIIELTNSRGEERWRITDPDRIEAGDRVLLPEYNPENCQIE
ncbi:MAG: hypothetical protein ABIH49_01645 [archaeon]